MRYRTRLDRRIVGCAAIMCMIGSMMTVQSASAATATWSGGGDGVNWSDVGNWTITNPNFVGQTLPADGDMLVFSAASGTINNDLTDLTASRLNFGSNDLVVTGNQLSLDTSQGTGNVLTHFVKGGSTTLTLDLDLVLVTSPTIYISSSTASLIFNGVISEVDGTPVAPTFRGGSGTWASAPFGSVYLNNANAFSGTNLTLSSNVYIDSFADLGTPQPLGAGPRVLFGGNNEDGFLFYTGDDDATVSQQFAVGASSTSDRFGDGGLINNGDGRIIWTGTQVRQTGTSNQNHRTFTLGGTNTADNDWQPAIQDNKDGGNATVALEKVGAGKWIVSGDNAYTGITTISEGTLVIDGDQSAATGLVTVLADAILGGNGTIGGSVVFEDDAKFLFNPLATLTVNGASVDLGNLSIADIIGLDGSADATTYTLIDGTATFDFSSVSNVGAANAVAIGGDKFAYFQVGSLQLVVIPEPASMALLGLGSLVMLARRRTRC